MNWRKTFRNRRVRREAREPVPMVLKVPPRSPDAKNWRKRAMLIAALVFSVGFHIAVATSYVEIDEPESYMTGVTTIQAQPEKKLDELPPPPEPEKVAADAGPGGLANPKNPTPSRGNLESDSRVAHSAGILGALDTGNESMDRLFDGTALGAELEKSMQGLVGISGYDMRGTGGLGMRGAGYGGGGSALGIGGLGTAGRGGGFGAGNAAYGVGAAGNLQRRAGNINISTGQPTIAGALDKSIIARIIQKYSSQIRYCYQRELTRNPNLYGKITIKFTIGPQGSVTSSLVAVSTMRNAAVETCVANTIKRIIFPAPRGGGIVVVNYPFIFKSEGQ